MRSEAAIDRAVATKVPRMLREAGVVDVRVDPLVHAYPPGHGRRIMVVDFAENARDRILAEELNEEAELGELIGAVRRHLEDPGPLVVSSLFVQAWGRRPGGRPFSAPSSVPTYTKIIPSLFNTQTGVRTLHWRVTVRRRAEGLRIPTPAPVPASAR